MIIPGELVAALMGLAAYLAVAAVWFLNWSDMARKASGWATNRYEMEEAERDARRARLALVWLPYLVIMIVVSATEAVRENRKIAQRRTERHERLRQIDIDNLERENERLRRDQERKRS